MHRFTVYIGRNSDSIRLHDAFVFNIHLWLALL
jgi:hypothetical protein